MNLLFVALEYTKQMAQEAEQNYNYIKILTWAITSLIPIIGILIGVVWNQSVKKTERIEQNVDESDKKIDKLVEQVTRLTTLIEESIFPVTKQNTDSINDIKVNCATNLNLHSHQKKQNNGNNN